MSRICKKYNSNPDSSGCTVTTEFCARRYQKATFNPDDSGIEHCRTCEDGKKAFEEWKDTFNNGPQIQPVKHTRFTTPRTKQCPICGEKTHSRICVKCKLKRKEKEESIEKQEEAVMSFKNGHKKCTYSKEDCPKQIWKEKLCYRHWHREHPDQKKTASKQDKFQVSHERSPRQEKVHTAQGNLGPNGGRASEPENLSFTGYIIKVDFSRYPKLHERLLKMSDEDIRNPGDQLMFLIRNTLTQMEAQA
jgi:hypothetical protein